MQSTYLETTKNIYKEAAENPQPGLCCTTTPLWQLPELSIAEKMLQMNYGCGSTVHPRNACAEECSKHENSHCKECAESCRRCADECRKMAA